MDMISELVDKINRLFNRDKLEAMARRAKLMVRNRKISPFELLQSFMMLSFQSSPSLEGLSSILSDLKIKVTRQALYTKTGQEGLEFCKTFLDCLIDLGS